MKMTLPNKLTLLRIIMVPFFVAALLYQYGTDSLARQISLALFLVASFTDFLDGYIARKYHLITNFGKFVDPLADKLLVCSALICFVALQDLNPWITLAVIAREFIISGFRLVAAERGIVIAAGIWGKLKTVCQMIFIVLMLLQSNRGILSILTAVFMWLMLALTVISLVDYIWRNREVLQEG